jgi:gastric triacylglycerol lipase
MNFSFALIVIVVVGQNHCQLIDESDEVLKHVKDSGFKGEVHRVETEDGYLLRVHRIVAKSENREKQKFPVFLMHGLLSSSGDFIVAGPSIALAYLLSSSGYDVWLGNSRGNKYSTSHVNLSSEANVFWQFSWHEIGHDDLPTMIDHMLNVTGSKKAFYVGHSQGTTSLLVLLSTRPEYNKKIIQADLLAPAAFMGNIPHPFLKYLSYDMFNDYAYLNFEKFWNFGHNIYADFCSGNDKNLCKQLIFAFFGSNKSGFEDDMVKVSVLKVS